MHPAVLSKPYAVLTEGARRPARLVAILAGVVAVGFVVFFLRTT
jgi:hypothetical protein